MEQQRIGQTKFLVYKIFDGLIFMASEYIKTIIREFMLILGQVMNTVIVMLLHFFYKPGHYESTVTNRGKMLEKGKAVDSMVKPKKKTNLFTAAKQRIKHMRSRSQLSTPVPEIQVSNNDSPNLKRNRTTPDFNSLQEKPESGSNMLNLVLDDTMDTFGVRLKTPVPSETPEEVENRQKAELEADPQICDDSSNEEISEMGTNRRNSISSEDIDGEMLDEAQYTIGKYLLSIVMRLGMIVWYIPSLFKEPQFKYHSSVRNDSVHLYEKKSTGLLQDIFVAFFQFIDEMAQAARLLIRFQFRKVYYQIKYAFSLFSAESLLSDEGIDNRSVSRVIKDEGFPYESLSCITKDGYVLHLDRIPNKNTKKVVYFQHGILDSGFAWVGNGGTHSLALRAHAARKVDVFLGNFRGYGMSPSHLQRLPATDAEDSEKKNYWDYSFNEHAFYDVRAFIEKIIEVKSKELHCKPEEIEIIAVAHSMGAGSILGYLSHSGITHQPHHISKAILLAPAGNHMKVSFAANTFATFAMPIIRRLVSYVGVTSGKKKIALAKLAQDFNNHPALRALLSVAVSQIMLGGVPTDSPFQLVHNLAFQSFNGTSVKVIDHFVQLARSHKFQAYDYGNEEENRKHYGQPQPWNLSEHFADISPMIPVHILMGNDDRVIPEDNVMKHVKYLQKFHGTDLVKAKKFRNVGHLELTYGSCDEIIKYVLRQIGQ